MMPNIKPFRPMLAADARIDQIQRIIDRDGFVYASWKLDGVRAVTMRGQLLSRTLKRIPNTYIQQYLSQPKFSGLDGELIVGAPNGEGVFQRTMSGVMSEAGAPGFMYYVFDMPFVDGTFEERLEALSDMCSSFLGDVCIKKVVQVPIKSLKELEEREQDAVDMQFEGLILKSPRAPYKQNRSTLTEGWMLKLKRFHDSEAEIIGFEELMRNQNEAKRDERGYAKRSSEQAGKVPGGTLGALVVRDVHRRDFVFNVGSGFDLYLRNRIGSNREAHLGKVVRYRYLPVGTKDLPRHPTFQGFRDPIDIDRKV